MNSIKQVPPKSKQLPKTVTEIKQRLRGSLLVIDVDSAECWRLDMELVDAEHGNFVGYCPKCQAKIWAISSRGLLECSNRHCGFRAFVPYRGPEQFG